MKKFKNHKWTKEKCKEEALKYNTKKDFRDKSPVAYRVSLYNQWHEYVCSHMLNKRKEKDFWSYSKCKEEALKYNTKKDFRENSNVAYNKIKSKKWNNLTTHLKNTIKPSGYWTKEKCHEEALKYNYIKDFVKNSGSAYTKSCINNWNNDICSHMESIGDRKHRCIYVYEFPDNHAYIGLTYNLEDRKYRHTNKGSVYDYIQETNLEPKIIKLTDYLEIDEAKEKENFHVNKYKNNGWNILNVAKTGSLGGSILKWTHKKCKEEALCYNSRYDFSLKSASAYNSARKNKWLDEICSHMILKHKPSSYWTKEKCQEEALKYETRSVYQLKSRGSYNSARKNKWLDEICLHMN